MAPLPKSQWMKLPAAKRGGWSYQRYRDWVNKTEGARAAHRNLAAQGQAYDPYFAPTPYSSLQHMAQNSVNSQILPLITALNQQIQARQKAGTSQINQATNAAVQGLQPLAGQIQNEYNRAYQQEQGVSNNITSFLKGQGANANANVDAAAKAAGLSPEAIASNKVLSDLGMGAAGTSLGLGSSTLSRLNSQGASDYSYAAGLPGRAREIGAYNLTNFQNTLNKDLESGTSQIRSQIPGLVNSTMQSLLQRELDKATARQGFALDMGKNQASAAANTGIINTGVSSNIGDGFAHDKYGNVVLGPSGKPMPWKGKPSGSGGGGKNANGLTPGQVKTRKDKIFNQLVNDAQAIHKAMMGRLNPHVNSSGLQINLPGKNGQAVTGGSPTNQPKGKARQNIIIAARQQAIEQVMAGLKRAYPGQSVGWYRTNAGQILSQAGFPKAADALAGPGYAKAQGIPSPAAAAVMAGGRGHGKQDFMVDGYSALAGEVNNMARRFKKGGTQMPTAFGALTQAIMALAKRHQVKMTRDVAAHAALFALHKAGYA